jgi:hypothetical protein
VIGGSEPFDLDELVPPPAIVEGDSLSVDIRGLWDEIENSPDDRLIKIDPSMIREAERRALRFQLERELRSRGRKDLVTYGRMRYGLHCPEPQLVLFGHQITVYQDLVKHPAYWLSAPRGFVKTSSTSDYIEWRIGHRPWMKWKFVSSNEKIAARRLRQIAFNIMFDSLFRSIFPEIQVDRRRFNKTNFNLIVGDQGTDLNIRDSTLEAWGYSSSPEGGRAHGFWFDDVCTYENSCVEQKERENIKEKIGTTWIPLRESPNVEMKWTCTLWHEQDTSHDLLRRPGMFKRLIKVSDDLTHLQEIRPEPTATYPLPDRRWNAMLKKWEPWWTRQALEDELKRDPISFGVAYWLRPVSASQTNIQFKSTWFWGDDADDESVPAVRYGPGPGHAIYRPEFTTLGVDLGFSGKREAAYTAIVAGGLLHDRSRVLLDAMYGRGWDIYEKLEHLAIMTDRWRPDKIIVESNVGQVTVQQLMVDRAEFRDATVEARQTGIAKHAKIKVLSEEFRDGKWVIPVEESKADTIYQGSPSKDAISELLRQVIGYPNASFSDFVIALMLAREGLREAGDIEPVWSGTVNMGSNRNDPVPIYPWLMGGYT